MTRGGATRAVSALLVGLAVAAGAGPRASGDDPPTTQREEKSMGAFGLTDGEFWSDPRKNLVPLAQARIEGDVEGIVIDAPTCVVLSERQTLPLQTFYSGTTDDLHDVRFDEHAALTAIDPEEGLVLVGPAVVRSSVPKPVGQERPSEGFTGQYYQCELRGLLGIPWRPGTYLVTALLRGKVSNRVTVALVSSAATFEDPEVKKYLESLREKQPPRQVSPPEGPLATYERLKGSLAARTEPGVTLAADRVVPGKPGQEGHLRGSFTLPTRPTDVLRRKAEKDEEKRPRVTAVVPITIVVVGSDDPMPWTIPMVVPSFADVGGDEAAPIATGQFQLDLMKLDRIADRPQTFFIYAFSGTHMAGPALMAVVDPAALPR